MRNRLMKSVCGLVGMIALTSCAWTNGSAGGGAAMARLDPAAIGKIDALCQGMVDEGFTPGAVLLIGIGDEIAMKKVYGNRMTKPAIEPMTEDTLFDMASLTKATATASAVMLLVQDGRIRLGDPVSQYVPEFQNTGKPDVTIKQILTHVTGFPAYTNAAKLAETYGPRPNPDGLIKQIASLNRVAEPDTKYVYSCLNYLTLARVVQNVAGENMDAFLHRRMWQPLGMKDTTFFPTEEQTARTAPTIYANGQIRRGAVHDPLAYYSACAAYASGNAGEFSTVDDMGIYCRMILNGGKLNGVEVFRPDIWELITTNQAPPGLDERSCGWGIWGPDSYATSLNNHPATCCLGHTGYTGTIIWMDKLSKAYVVLLTTCVYPADKEENKNGVIKARKQAISTVIDHLDLYKNVRGEAATAAPAPSTATAATAK